jgi:hypothetical protein
MPVPKVIRRPIAGLLIVVVVLAMVAGACAAAPAATPLATANPSASVTASIASPGPPASSTFGPDDVTHPTGATQIVLRYDVAGGFVPLEFSVGLVPQFTLYGDGRAIWASAGATGGSTLDGLSTGARDRTAVLTEPQVQDLLKFALLQGGLGIAVGPYDATGVADAPTTAFEIHADGNDKTVSAYALGIGSSGAAAQIRASLVRLADRLSSFGGNSAPWEPVSYRAMLLDATGVTGVKVRAWPWPDVRQADFRADPAATGLQVRKRVLTSAEAQALGVTGFQGGILSGLYVRLDDGKTAQLVLRPLLPDERS